MFVGGTEPCVSAAIVDGAAATGVSLPPCAPQMSPPNPAIYSETPGDLAAGHSDAAMCSTVKL